jgi:predicted nucleic acid-binding protein
VGDATPEAVCDAGPLIHLDELGALDLLADFAATLVPGAVWAEVERHRPEALSRPGCPLTRVAVTQTTDARLATLTKAMSLGMGEQEAILLARTREGPILLTDDAAARIVAEGMGMEVHGTIGVLVRAVRRSQRTPAEVVALLGAIPERCSLHLRAALLDRVIRQVRAEWKM